MYMPPEQISEEKRLVAQSDIYSLGASMYALLARRTPYKASNLNSLMYRISEYRSRSHCRRSIRRSLTISSNR